MKYLLFLLPVLLFLSCSSEEEPIPTQEEFPFEGKWLGTWNDDMFSNIAISADIRKVGENQYSGPTYIQSTGSTGPYTPCCGATDNNGTITFSTDGENQVTDYVFRQVAPDYRGGCPGTFTGTGSRSGDRLTINFTGTDCDGFHDNGRFVWKED